MVGSSGSCVFPDKILVLLVIPESKIIVINKFLNNSNATLPFQPLREKRNPCYIVTPSNLQEEKRIQDRGVYLKRPIQHIYIIPTKAPSLPLIVYLRFNKRYCVPLTLLHNLPLPFDHIY